MPYCTCNCTSASTHAVIWNDWNCGSTGGATTWHQWTGTNTITTAGTGTTGNCWCKWTNTPYVPKPETAKERQAREQREREQRAEWEARRQTAAAAEKRAEELFQEHLDDVQRKEVAEKRHFHVISEKGRRFRIHIESAHGNVSEIGEDGKIKNRLCAQPKGLPKFDQILAQKLALEHCEDQFLRVANAS